MKKGKITLNTSANDTKDNKLVTPTAQKKSIEKIFESVEQERVKRAREEREKLNKTHITHPNSAKVLFSPSPSTSTSLKRVRNAAGEAETKDNLKDKKTKKKP